MTDKFESIVNSFIEAMRIEHERLSADTLQTGDLCALGEMIGRSIKPFVRPYMERHALPSGFELEDLIAGISDGTKQTAFGATEEKQNVQL